MADAVSETQINAENRTEYSFLEETELKDDEFPEEFKDIKYAIMNEGQRLVTSLGLQIRLQVELNLHLF